MQTYPGQVSLQLVVQHELELVAGLDPDSGAGELAVVEPCVEGNAARALKVFQTLRVR